VKFNVSNPISSGFSVFGYKSRVAVKITGTSSSLVSRNYNENYYYNNLGL
jgi:hypothetical protein